MKHNILISIDDLLSGELVENNRMEFKKGWNPKTIMRTVCAFANDFENEGSGYIVVGVDEENGKPIRPVYGFNVDLYESVQKELLSYCQSILPAYFPRLSLEQIDNKQVLVIWVPGGSNRPYKVPDDVKAKQRVYNFRIRQYSSSIVPNAEQEQELLQLTAKIPFDDRIFPQASLTDLDIDLMRDHLKETKSKLFDESKDMLLNELADKMNLSEGSKEHLFPKNVGLLMFTKNPSSWFKGAKIEVVIFPEGLAGKEFYEKTFSGSIQQQLVDALSYIQTNVISIKVIKLANSEQAIRTQNYPFAAIEEALSNAVYHRNYELHDPIEVRVLPEAIEIISYNGADPSLKKSDFQRGTVRARRYRNRRVGEFLKELRLTEGRGTGIPTIIKALRDNGSPQPIFDIDEPDRRHFIVELPIHTSFLDTTDQVTDQVTDQGENNPHIVSSNEMLQHMQRIAKAIAPQRLDEYNVEANNITIEQKKVLSYCIAPQKRKEILEICLHLTNHTTNFKKHILPLINSGFLQRTIPDRPNSQYQKYLITKKGKIILAIKTSEQTK